MRNNNNDDDDNQVRYVDLPNCCGGCMAVPDVGIGSRVPFNRIHITADGDVKPTSLSTGEPIKPPPVKVLRMMMLNPPVSIEEFCKGMSHDN